MDEGLTGRFPSQFPALTDLPGNLSQGDVSTVPRNVNVFLG
jgi:hypothetical protein